MNLLKHIFIVFMVFASLTPFLWPLTTIVDRPVDASIWVVVAVSAVLNAVTIFYHFIIPPHPKFLMVGWRRAILNVHILGGLAEFAAGMVFLLAKGGELAGLIMALSALTLHTPTAFAQVSLVFGSRAVMRPSYMAATFIHAFCAFMLLLHPASTHWVVSTFLVFNIYVWCRIYYYLFERYDLFPDSKYSVSILAAGVTALPGVLGPTATLAIAAPVAVYIALYSMLFIKNRAEFLEFVRERSRDNAFDPGEANLWDEAADEADAGAARRFFTLLDKDGDGQLTSDDLADGLFAAAHSAEVMKRVIQNRDGDERVDLESFERHFWSIPEVRNHARDLEGMRSAKSERDKAELVFHRLDRDGDGILGAQEMEALLDKWAMPRAESGRWLEKLRGPDFKGIDLDTFFKKMRPVWRFIYYEIMEATTGRKQDMLGRAMAARRAEAKTREIRRDVRRELVGGLPFLRGATAAFLDELAESLVEETYKAGHRLIEEGSPGDTCWIVRRGSLRVSKGAEILGDLGPGDWVGEGALLADTARLASVDVTADARLYAISRPSLGYLIGRNPEMTANLRQIHEERRLQVMRRAVQLDLLGKVDFLRTASPHLLEELARQLEIRVTEGRVFREGDLDDRFFLVGRGTVQVMHGDEIVAELGEGSYFGEGAILGGSRRSATVATVGRAVLYELSRAAFDGVMRDHPGVAREIRGRHAERAGSRVQRLVHERLVRQVSFLQDADTAFLDALASDLRAKTVPDGHRLFQEGAPGDRMYFIARGAVRISREGITVAELAAGAYFGEMALLTSQPRSASATTIGITEILELDRAGFERLVHEHPAVRAQLDQVRRDRADQLQSLGA